MALGKYSRVDGRRSANYCSTVTLVVFVAFCLVGVWMMTSSSVVPVENETSTEEVKDVVTEKFTENTDAKSKQFDDNPGDLPKDAINGDTNTNEVEREPHKTTTEQDGEKKFIDESKSGDTDGGDEAKVTVEKEAKKEETKSSVTGQMLKSDSENVAKLDEKKDDGTSEENEGDTKKEAHGEKPSSGTAQYDLLKERTVQNSSSFSTQVKESEKEKESQKQPVSQHKKTTEQSWKLCNVTAKQDFIPCLDNLEAIKHLKSTKHYEHRERHCPDVPPTCLIPLPEVYKRPISWPQSRDKIWYFNVPHTKLAEVKGHQNWVKVTGEYLTFPGGGTQFKHGALHYIEFIESMVPEIAWGRRSRVVLDVGCGVASFGGFLFEKNVLTMSFAPKDEHEAQVQFALERGIPAISAVMGTTRLPFPARVFDVVHCARCRVPWHIEGGKLLLELNRLLRPGGYFVWSATPVYQKLDEDVQIWNEMSKLTKAMCWELVKKGKDSLNSVGAAIYRKPVSNDCYSNRSQKEPPLCKESDDADAAWNVPLQACMHKVPEEASRSRGGKWPGEWPGRLSEPPFWLLPSQVGVYGKPAPQDFSSDYDHWNHIISTSYLHQLGFNWSSVRNVMDMRAVYGGFAAALKEQNIWVMSVVPVDSPDTLPLIYERGLFGIYHDWCESFSTYPRSYDLLHADHILSKLKNRCELVGVLAEVDRMLRPEGKLIVRDDLETLGEVEGLVKSMNWEVRVSFSKNNEGLLSLRKGFWRPTLSQDLPFAIDP